MPQISLDGISKTFKIAQRPTGRFGAIRGAFVRETKEIKALDNIIFTIGEGELIGYIGPNGAGKSTTIKVMSGILTPDSGKCEIMGRTPWKERIDHVSQIGVVFGQRSQLWWDLPVMDSFDLLKDIYDIKTDTYKKRLYTLVETMNIGDLLKIPVRQMSLGQRMRCEVVAALIHSPKILFLDEPTIGLDAVSKLSLREFLKQENKQNGVTMILTTHDMDDIEVLCERVMVIGHGQLLFDGNLDVLKNKFSPLRCIFATVSSSAWDEDLAEVLKERKADKIKGVGVSKIKIDGDNWTVWFDPTKVPAHKIVADMAETLPLTDITIEEQNIDEMIAAMYREMKL